MVEISESGSGEGLGWVTGRGYSTAVPRLLLRAIVLSVEVYPNDEFRKIQP